MFQMSVDTYLSKYLGMLRELLQTISMVQYPRPGPARWVNNMVRLSQLTVNNIARLSYIYLYEAREGFLYPATVS